MSRLALWLVILASAAWGVPARPGAWAESYQGRRGELRGDERGFSVGGVRVASDPARPRGFARGIPRVVGTVPLLAVGVQFPDVPGPMPFQQSADLWAGELNGYFHVVSRGNLQLQVQTPGMWVTASRPLAHYGADGSGVDDASGPIHRLAAEALVAVDPWVDFRVFDSDGDGVVEAGEAHFFLVHSGSDQASTGRAEDIWSHRWWVYSAVPLVLDGVRLGEPMDGREETTAGYVMVAHDDPLGVAVHELLHSFGAPDLYDTEGDQVPVGFWSVMDVGLWLGSPQGSSPCRPGGYLEWDVDADPSNGLTGWVVPRELGDGLASLNALGTGGTEVGIVRTPFPDEFFLLENRARQGLDVYIPEPGLLIFHIDTSQPVNNVESQPPFRVWLEDPGLRPLKRGAAYRQEDGPAQSAFTPATSPNSHSNTGLPTGISILDIGPSGQVMSFVVSGTEVLSANLSLQVFPQPAVRGGTLRVILPRDVPSSGRLLMVGMDGRRIWSGPCTGQGQVVPVPTVCGTYALVYRVADGSWCAPFVVLP